MSTISTGQTFSFLRKAEDHDRTRCRNHLGQYVAGNLQQKKQLNELKESFRLANETLPRTIISII